MGFGRSRRTVAELAHGYGLAFADAVAPGSDGVVGMNLSGTRSEVAEIETHTEAHPRIQFGNHGPKLMVSGADDRPSRRGYVAVSHGLALPRMFLASHAYGAVTPLNVVSTVINVAGLMGDGEGGGAPSQRFSRESKRIRLPKGAGFRLQVETARAKEGEALFVPEVLVVATEVTRSFDVEVRPGWVIASSLDGDITTADPAVWEWSFSVASRLIDVLRLWGAGPGFGATWPLYADQSVARPASVDGALRFVRRSR